MERGLADVYLRRWATIQSGTVPNTSGAREVSATAQGSSWEGAVGRNRILKGPSHQGE